MKYLFGLLGITVCLAKANPIKVEVINEFQTASSDLQRIELKYLEIPTDDTIFYDQPLLNTQVLTPGGTAVVDTDIYLPGQGYAVIDTSVLNGPFFLPPDSGYITVVLEGLGDEISYPCSSFSFENFIIPAPPAGASASKIYFWIYDDYEYYAKRDWYVDNTPTFGEGNDDYPGCEVSGTVYGSGNPLVNAEVIAEYVLDGYVCNPGPFYTTCTTYTNINGFYSFDSLLPVRYHITASAPGYQPFTQVTEELRALKLLTNFDFNLLGILENDVANLTSSIYVYPNPFSKLIFINFEQVKSEKAKGKSYELKIYDATGKLIKVFSRTTHYAVGPTQITWDATDENGEPVSPGIYFICLPEKRIKVIKL